MDALGFFVQLAEDPDNPQPGKPPSAPCSRLLLLLALTPPTCRTPSRPAQELSVSRALSFSAIAAQANLSSYSQGTMAHDSARLVTLGRARQLYSVLFREESRKVEGALQS
jgi:hypothetical protein